jgi:hydrogenase maturation protease
VSNQETSILTIIGCGNLNRCDDGVGVIIAQRLQQLISEYSFPNVRIYDTGTAGMEIMFQARGSEKLILIDACVTDSEPGTIFEIPGEELEVLPELSYNLHDFRWDNALAVGRKIFNPDFPKEVLVYLIEAESLNLGLELSETVEKAAIRVFEKIQQQIWRYLEGSSESGI